MTVHHDKQRKPFQIGQLLRFIAASGDHDYGLDIALDFRWNDSFGLWDVYTLSQQTGVKEWLLAEDFEPVGENDENETE